MSEEPFLTEWMDLEPYPGPERSEERITSLANLVKNPTSPAYHYSVHPDGEIRSWTHLRFEVETRWEAAKKAVMDWWDHYAPAPEYPIKDQDKPIRRNKHGPYEGSQFTHNGKKLY